VGDTSHTFERMDEKPTSWFLIAWPERGAPQILMEFWTREEADAALDAVRQIDDQGADGGTVTGVCSASVLIQDPFMQRTLAAWDEQLHELESIEREVLRGAP
jgi:hypothetical protein